MSRLYWVIGTSTKKHISTFQELLKLGATTGETFSILIENKNNSFILYDEKRIPSKSATTLRQTIDGLLALGLIRESKGKYIVLFDQVTYEDIVNYSKIYLLKHSRKDSVEKYRFSKIINMLVESKYITMSDIKHMNISQKRGELTIDKIYKEISSYEKKLSKDEFFLKKAKEYIDEQ